jgi:hypothetical protein
MTIAGTYQIKRGGLPAKPLQARGHVVDTESGANSYECRPAHISYLKLGNPRVDRVKPTHTNRRKEGERLEYDDGPDEEGL